MQGDLKDLARVEIARVGLEVGNARNARLDTAADAPVSRFLQVGEAMAIIMVSGNVPNMPESLFTPVRFLTTAIASEMSYAAVGSLCSCS